MNRGNPVALIVCLATSNRSSHPTRPRTAVPSSG